jgi:hypothetical protein
MDQNNLAELLSYNKETGLFTWRKPGKGRRASKSIAGCQRPDGYYRISINKKLYYAHRLAWLYVYGRWPTQHIDHINGDPSDNRIDNLREADPHQNGGNKKIQKSSGTGVKGVCFDKRRNNYVAYISPGGKRKTLGQFPTIEEAKTARTIAAQAFYGEFSRE